MTLYFGSDHGGFAVKNSLIEVLRTEGYAIEDCGSYNSDDVDYPDFALAVSRAVSGIANGRPVTEIVGRYQPEESSHRLGILLCRSGEGMEMAANKVPGIRAALVWGTELARESRTDNDANIAVLPADYLSAEDALRIVRIFISTPFSGANRHLRRLEKLHAIERMN
jgi:ribose 5-phosphate isomerase B